MRKCQNTDFDGVWFRRKDFKAMGEMSVHAMDRISELPPFIIHQIMSNLSTEEVARTSILSKTWNCLRASFPIIDFDQTYFVGKVGPYDFSEKMNHISWFRQRLGKFMKFVDVSLHRYCQLNLCIQKFRLFVGLLNDNESSSLVDKWVRMAVERDVKELDFEVLTDVDAVYKMPPIIFSAKLVTQLYLSGCKLENPSVTIWFPSLKTLDLCRVFIDEKMVQLLVSGCPVLEGLCFFDCQGYKCLSVVSKAHKLRSMCLYEYSDELESVQIVAPSLQQFILELNEQKLRLQVINLAGCAGLKYLLLMGVTFTDQEVDQFISHFPLLEDMSCRISNTEDVLCLSSM